MDVRLETLGQDLAIAAERGDIPKVLDITRELRRRDEAVRAIIKAAERAVDSVRLQEIKADGGGYVFHEIEHKQVNALRSAIAAFQEPSR